MRKETIFELPGVKGYCLSPEPETVQEDKAAIDAHYASVALLPVQTHSLNVGLAVTGDEVFEDTDAVVTFKPGLAVGVRTADCVPILLYAPDINGVAAVHAGWKGTIGGIVANTVKVLAEHGADPAKIRAFFGPSISTVAYEVSPELARQFADAGYGECVSYPNGENGRPHLDLQGVNRQIMLGAGLKDENINLHGGCTLLTKNDGGNFVYQSYRRNHTALRNLTLIVLECS